MYSVYTIFKVYMYNTCVLFFLQFYLEALPLICHYDNAILKIMQDNISKGPCFIF